MKNVQIPSVTLNNGVEVPVFGLGVWKAAEGGEVENAVKTAIQSGYRLIDTAAIYGNEAGVGQAIRAAGVARDELFITTKLWNAHHEYDAALRAFDESLSKLDCDYVDLYLIHWPLPMDGKFPEAWRALEKLYADKRVRAIGVSNFKRAHLEKLFESSGVTPAVNQIELHPMLQGREDREFAAAHDIRIEAYSPLMRGGEVLEHPVIAGLAEKHGKTAAQVVLRWHVQLGVIVIPKSVNDERIRENAGLWDFELDEADMCQIEALDAGRRLGADPDTANFK